MCYAEKGGIKEKQAVKAVCAMRYRRQPGKDEVCRSGRSSTSSAVISNANSPAFDGRESFPRGTDRALWPRYGTTAHVNVSDADATPSL